MLDFFFDCMVLSATRSRLGRDTILAIASHSTDAFHAVDRDAATYEAHSLPHSLRVTIADAITLSIKDEAVAMSYLCMAGKISAPLPK